jgi:hypothetical protein
LLKAMGMVGLLSQFSDWLCREGGVELQLHRLFSFPLFIELFCDSQNSISQTASSLLGPLAFSQGVRVTPYKNMIEIRSLAEAQRAQRKTIKTILTLQPTPVTSAFPAPLRESISIVFSIEPSLTLLTKNHCRCLINLTLTVRLDPDYNK